jgi:hypothetical protein
VDQAREQKLRARMKAVLQKPAEEGRRRGAIEAMIVVENPYLHVPA